MSMTREEATKILEYHVRKRSMEWGERDDELSYTEAIDLALTALRGPTREQVERMRGEVKRIDKYLYACSKCGAFADRGDDFCHRCGAPLTDEAVDIQLKRIEALKGLADYCWLDKPREKQE